MHARTSSPSTRALVACALALAALVAVAPTGARSQAHERGAADTPPARASRSRARRPNSLSVGYAFEGRLRRGVLLEESSVLRYTGEYRASGRFWGTRELVTLLERAAAHVARRLPGARLSVGELSAERGGRISGHRSHQNGRDVDIALYMLDARGRPFDPFGFAAFDARGHGLTPNEGLRFDDARNWELVSRLVTDPDARVQYIFVADSLKARLLATGRRRRAPRRVLERVEAVLHQPSHGHPHRNHFHVRIYCPPGDRPACQDRAPFHPWYPGTPPAASPSVPASADPSASATAE